MYKQQSVSAIIVAGGTGERFGADKLSLALAGEPVLVHSVRAFLQVPEVDEVVVVCHYRQLEHYQQLLTAAFPTAPLQFVTGGRQRWQSSLRGLRAARGELVAIHDAARPLIQPAQIYQSLVLAADSGAAMVAAPATDSIKVVNERGEAVDALDRSTIYLAQTPQTFARPLIERAYSLAHKLHYRKMTDESELLTRFLHHPVQIVPSSNQNLKITFPQDLPLAETFYRRLQEQKGSDEMSEPATT